MIAVAAAVIYKDSKILIARRAAHQSQAGYWEFPGGKVEPDETPEACLLREIDEELSMKIQVYDYLMESVHQYAEKTIVLKAYSCRYQSGEINLTVHDQAIWVAIDDLDNYNFAPADRPFVPYLIANK